MSADDDLRLTQLSMKLEDAGYEFKRGVGEVWIWKSNTGHRQAARSFTQALLDASLHLDHQAHVETGTGIGPV